MSSIDREWDVGRLMELSGSYWQTCALHAAVKLDVFTKMGGSECSAGDLARRVGADERALAMLLDALAAMKLVAKNGDRFSAERAALELLSRESEHSIASIILHHRDLLPGWAKLDQAVATGGPVRRRASYDEAEGREHFLMGMFNIAINLAPRIVPDIDLGGRARLLDLGGGPGTWAIQFCLHNPGLEAAVFDLPTTRPFAEKTIARFGVGERVRFVDGNFLKDPVPSGFDVAWLSQILHSENPERCRAIVAKTVGALEPGGTILVHEFLLNNAKDGPLHPALFSLNMLLSTDGGRAYSGAEIAAMLEAAGVQDIRHLDLPALSRSGIIQGIVA